MSGFSGTGRGKRSRNSTGVIRDLPEDPKCIEEMRFAILLRESGGNILGAYEWLRSATEEITRLWSEQQR
jgi:hypothetical protein